MYHVCYFRLCFVNLLSVVLSYKIDHSVSVIQCIRIAYFIDRV